MTIQYNVDTHVLYDFIGLRIAWPVQKFALDNGLNVIPCDFAIVRVRDIQI